MIGKMVGGRWQNYATFAFLAMVLAEPSAGALRSKEPDWDCLTTVSASASWVDDDSSGDISVGDCYRLDPIYANLVDFGQDQTAVSVLPNRTDRIAYFVNDRACQGLRITRIFFNHPLPVKRPGTEDRFSLAAPASEVAKCKQPKACGFFQLFGCEPVFIQRNGVEIAPWVQRRTRECESSDFQTGPSLDREPWRHPFTSTDSTTGEKVCYESCGRTREAGTRCVSTCPRESESEYYLQQANYCWRTGWVSSNHHFSTGNNLGSSLLKGSGDVLFVPGAQQRFANSESASATPTM